MPKIDEVPHVPLEEIDPILHSRIPTIPRVDESKSAVATTNITPSMGD